MDTTKLEIAKGCAFNIKEEGKAIQEYTEFLTIVNESVLTLDEKAEINEIISEIISDEQDHQLKLQKLYIALTGIEPNGD